MMEISGVAPRARVLVVDDDGRNRTLVSAWLEGEHELLQAPGAEPAYTLLAGGGIDLVLLDVMMPGIDGFTACREIKRRFGDPFLPVLLLTALGDQHHRNLGFEAGCDDFITKPVDRRELQMRVRAFLRIRAQEHQIRRQLEELRRLDRLKDDLAALVVHDLRNPIAGLSGLLQAMRREAQAGDEQGEVLDAALQATRNLRDTVEDMLRVRMLEEARLELQPARVQLLELAHQAVDSLRGEAVDRRQPLTVDGEAIEAAVDVKLLRRALENLIANGLRYTRMGAGVQVRVSRAGDAIHLDVEDRGPGVPEALKGELFQKYGSVEARRGNPRRGNGLGLYLVRLTVEAHGGTIAALDRPGGGTTFRVALPGPAGR